MVAGFIVGATSKLKSARRRDCAISWGWPLDEEDAAGFEVGGVDEPEAHALEEAEEVVGALEASVLYMAFKRRRWL